MNKIIRDYKDKLINDELSLGTIENYLREAKSLNNFLEEKGINLDEELTKDNAKKIKPLIIDYVREIKGKYKNATISNKIIAINKYLKFLDLEDSTVKNIRVQKKSNRESLTISDYKRILRQAQIKGTDRDILMLNLLFYTGIRVSEIEYFTVKSLDNGYMQVYNKGKYREVPLIKPLISLAKKYIKQNNICSGSILLSKQGNPLHRSTVHKRLKYLGGQARVRKNKVYPHSIRHLFAKEWLKHNNNNIPQLADLLGHESLETTRRYTTLSVNEARETIKF